MAAFSRIDELRRKYEENPRRFFAPLANEHRKAGDLETSIEICRRQLAAYPEHISGHIVLGQALYEARRPAEARAVFEASLAIDPENLIALRHLGDIARGAGDEAAARHWYGRILEADPRNDDIAAQLASLAAAAHAPQAPAPVEPAAGPPDFATAFERARGSGGDEVPARWSVVPPPGPDAPGGSAAPEHELLDFGEETFEPASFATFAPSDDATGRVTGDEGPAGSATDTAPTDPGVAGSPHAVGAEEAAGAPDAPFVDGWELPALDPHTGEELSHRTSEDGPGEAVGATPNDDAPPAGEWALDAAPWDDAGSLEPVVGLDVPPADDAAQVQLAAADLGRAELPAAEEWAADLGANDPLADDPADSPGVDPAAVSAGAPWEARPDGPPGPGDGDSVADAVATPITADDDGGPEHVAPGVLSERDDVSGAATPAPAELAYAAAGADGADGADGEAPAAASDDVGSPSHASEAGAAEGHTPNVGDPAGYPWTHDAADRAMMGGGALGGEGVEDHRGHAGEIGERVEGPPAAPDAVAGPSHEAPPFAAASDDARVAPSELAALAGGAFATETLAELFVQQGHLAQAEAVYARLVAERAGDSALAARLDAVRARIRGNAEPSSAVPADASPLDAGSHDSGSHDGGWNDEAADGAGASRAATPHVTSPTDAAPDRVGGVELSPETEPSRVVPAAGAPGAAATTAGSFFRALAEREAGGEPAPRTTDAAPPDGTGKVGAASAANSGSELDAPGVDATVADAADRSTDDAAAWETMSSAAGPASEPDAPGRQDSVVADAADRSTDDAPAAEHDAAAWETMSSAAAPASEPDAPGRQDSVVADAADHAPAAERDAAAWETTTFAADESPGAPVGPAGSQDRADAPATERPTDDQTDGPWDPFASSDVGPADERAAASMAGGFADAGAPGGRSLLEELAVGGTPAADGPVLAAAPAELHAASQPDSPEEDVSFDRFFAGFEDLLRTPGGEPSATGADAGPEEVEPVDAVGARAGQAGGPAPAAGDDGTAGAQPDDPASAPADDLEQFNAWLRGLGDL